MATVAEQLRHARERMMLNVYQVAELTKMKTDHIRALEAGDYECFSAPVYLRGFIRTYARTLKLDPAQLLKDLDFELGDKSNLREPPALTAKSNRTLDFLMLQLSRLNWRIILATLAVGLVIVLTATALRNQARTPADRLKDLGPGLYQPPAVPSQDRLPLPPS